MNNHQSGPSHERWLLSYADFITLLFAVFVVLFASASAGKHSPREISAAVMEALHSGVIRVGRFDSPSRSTSEQQTPNSKSRQDADVSKVPGAVLMELAPSLKKLTEELKSEIARKQIEIRLEPRGLVISLSQAVFFPSGEATINPVTYPITDKIAEVITSLPNSVRLEGHTDAIPIRNARFASNWELSAARSIAMLDLFVSRNHVVRNRLSIAGFADTEPLGPNENAEGRARNRRVDVVILNDLVAGELPPAKK